MTLVTQCRSIAGDLFSLILMVIATVLFAQQTNQIHEAAALIASSLSQD